jgi:hypothetical protein
MTMGRTIFCTEQFVGDVVRRLVKDYDRIEVVWDKAKPPVVTETGASLGEDRNLRRRHLIVTASLPDPLLDQR